MALPIFSFTMSPIATATLTSSSCHLKVVLTTHVLAYSLVPPQRFSQMNVLWGYGNMLCMYSTKIQVLQQSY